MTSLNLLFSSHALGNYCTRNTNLEIWIPSITHLLGKFWKAARSKSLDPFLSAHSFAADTSVGTRSALEALSITEAKWLHGTRSNLLNGLNPKHVMITNREGLDPATYLRTHALVVALVTDTILSDDGIVTPAKIYTGRFLLLQRPGLAGAAGS